MNFKTYLKESQKPIAVIIKGNPKRTVKGDLYDKLKSYLTDKGYEVEFDDGKEFTEPRRDAAVWIGHSRGADRLRFAPDSIKTVAIGSKRKGAINHPQDVVDIEPDEYDDLPVQTKIYHNSWHPSFKEKLDEIL